MRRLVLGLVLFAGVAIASQEERPALWTLIEGAIAEHGGEEEYRTVLEHLAGIPSRRAGVSHRLKCVERALIEPWTPPAIARDLRDMLSQPLQKKAQARTAELWPGVAGFLDLELQSAESEGDLEDLDVQLEWIFNRELKGLALLEALSSFVGEANALLQLAYAQLDDAQRDLIFETAGEFREAWYRSHFPKEELNADQNACISDWTALLRSAEVDHARILAIMSRLARLAEPAFLDTLKGRLRRVKERTAVLGFEGDVRAVVGDAETSRVVLGGTKKTIYKGYAALVIDLDGDDQYERAAAVSEPFQSISIVLDLKGDDTYSGTPGPASAVGGCVMLVDVEGNDTYGGGRFTQGAAVFGAALLLDLAGDDRYTMEDYGQGHALAGTGLLYDVRGDDTYEAWAFAQGGGLTWGFSALVDGAGNDSYLADLHWPDVYGNSGPEIYHGASQGYCTGIRSGGGMAGGVAALIDLGDGSDRYQSGNFSQGGAYFFSFALMYDDGGDDENFGTRYSQGFGVHQGAAVRWDRAGNDTYTGRSVAHTGMAWDEGVGYFLEDGGDDVYSCGDLALGGAAQTGVAIAIDGGGKDIYKTGRQSQGGTGSSEYHNKPSIGVLIDLGGDKDSYTMEGRDNGVLKLTPDGFSLFLDSGKQTLKEAARKLK
ncbi:MAG: hypothetical protein ACI9F9_001635 [Candidatus Paceibacteria bacterium]